MLYIKDGDKEHTLHIGDAMPAITGRVVTFQADGHELTELLEALSFARKKEKIISRLREIMKLNGSDLQGENGQTSKGRYSYLVAKDTLLSLGEDVRMNEKT